MKKNKNYIQGDVDLIATSLPENTEKIDFSKFKIINGNEIVIRHGESGNMHRLKVKTKEFEKQVEIRRDANGRYYLVVKKETELVHNNPFSPYQLHHRTTILKPQVYLIETEREYNPFLEEIQKRQD